MKIIKPNVEVLTPIDENEMMKRIELIARTCYKSEDLITDTSAERLVKKLIDSDHCFDEQTEILTIDGWKKHTELTPYDLFATLSPNGILEYLPSQGYTCYEYSGDMVRVESNMVDLLVTNKHKLYVCKTTTKSGRTKNNYELIEANDMIKISHSYLKNCNDFCSQGIGIELELLKLIGFAIGDGCIDKTRLSFHIKKSRKINYLLNIFQQLKINYLYNKKNNLISISLNQAKLIGYQSIFNDIYNKENEKRIPHNLLRNMSKNEANALLDGLLNSDGSLTKDNSYFYCTTSEELKQQFQQLCLHCGFSSNKMRDNDLSKSKGAFASTKICTKYSVIRRYNKPEINIGKGTSGKVSKIENWKGMVWCVNVNPYNTIYVRRNGKPVWCGNCAMLEHVSISVKVICDRGVSHEIVRHRMASYAQESQRYCNYGKDKFGGEITFIKPCFWDEDSYLYQEWERQMLLAEGSYISMLGMGATPQEARSVLPNSTKTEIVMTLNLRSWRNFFKLRLANDAHPQMREVANLIYEKLHKITILFDDFKNLANQ